MTPEIKSVLDKYTPAQQKALGQLHDLILDVAEETQGVGKIGQSLKWGQPTFSTRTGSPVRIDAVKNSSKIAIYFICTTKLVDGFRERYPDKFEYEGNRAILLEPGKPFDKAALKHCIAMALTYKLKQAA